MEIDGGVEWITWLARFSNAVVDSHLISAKERISDHHSGLGFLKIFRVAKQSMKGMARSD